LSDDRKYLTMTDGFGIGKMKLIGSRDLHLSYDKKLIKRVRLIKRADGFYTQFCVDVERNENIEITNSKSNYSSVNEEIGVGRRKLV